MDAHGPVRLVSLVSDVEWQRHIRIALGPSAIIRWIRHPRELDDTSGVASANLVLWHLEPRADMPASMPSTIHRMRLAVPASPILLYGRVAPAVAMLILAAGRLGIDRVALRGFDDLARVVAGAIDERRFDDVCKQIMARIGSFREPAALVIAHCLRHAFDSVMTVDRLSREFGVDRKTLHNRLRSAGLPSPAVLITWSRLLVAGSLLDDARYTVGGVARMLHFSSPSELRGMLSRYMHARATDLRRGGALTAIVGAFQSVTTGRASRSRLSGHETAASKQDGVP